MDRFPHPYDECFVPFVNQCGSHTRYSLREFQLLKYDYLNLRPERVHIKFNLICGGICLKILEDFDFVNHLPKCDIPRDIKGFASRRI